jgi:hypothetical protein
MNETVLNKKKNLEQKINSSLNNVYFDVQGFDPTNIAESQIARLLTKVAVGSVTVIWSIMELKNLLKFRKTLKG